MAKESEAPEMAQQTAEDLKKKAAALANSKKPADQRYLQFLVNAGVVKP